VRPPRKGPESLTWVEQTLGRGARIVATRVLTGGLTRFAMDEGAMVVNTTQNGGFKDTWVVDR